MARLLSFGAGRRSVRLVMILSVAILTALPVVGGTAGADGHVMTAPDINVAPDGDWTGQVTAGGQQNWTFTLAEARIQAITIQYMQPAGSSLDVSADAQILGTVTEDSSFGVDLAAGDHTVTISNPGAEAVQYDLYLGKNVSVSLSPTSRTVGPDGGTVSFAVTMRNSQIFFGACAKYIGGPSGSTASFSPSRCIGASPLTQTVTMNVTVPALAPSGTTSFIVGATGGFFIFGCPTFTPCGTENTLVSGKITKLVDPHIAIEAKLDSMNTSLLDAPVSSRASQVSVDALETKADSIEVKLDNLNISQLDAPISSRASQVSVDALEVKADALEVKADALEGKLDAHTTALNTRASAIDAALSALEGKADAIEAKLDARLNATISSRASQTSVNALEVKADALEGKVDKHATNLNTRASSIDTALSTLETKADALEGKADAHATETEAIEQLFRGLVTDRLEVKRLHLQVIAIRGQGAPGGNLRFLVGVDEAGLPVPQAEITLVGVNAAVADPIEPISFVSVPTASVVAPGPGSGLLEVQVNLPDSLRDAVMFQFALKHDHLNGGLDPVATHHGTIVVHVIGANNLGAGQ